MIYHFDEEGVGSIYTGNDVITLIYGDKGVTLNTKDGEVAAPAEPGTLKVSGGFLWEIDENGIATKHIVDPDKSGTYYKTVDGLLYTVRYDTAAATALSAIYKGKVYRQGAILKRAGYIVYNKYIYKVTATGTATKFLKNKKAKLSKKYFYICETPYGNKYLFSIRYRTGYAVAYVKDKTKTSTYGYYTANTKYWVVYNTGRILQSKGDSEPRQVLVDNAVKYMGYCESAVGGPSHMGIVSIYNKHKPLPRNYTMKFRDAWCATYVSAMFIETGMISIFPKECSCAYQVAKWKKLGRWTENDAYVPKKGDIIYYDWQDSGKGNNKGKPDHVGIVLEVNNGKITVIEGNYNDRVQKRVIKVNGRYIRGYGLPWYAKAVK
ncbi:MAG: CHAP domain-containing protein [Eubacterium sp.]|nr:CHAP domain-containing protein [Candidatus Colimonas fimequi]